MCKGYPFLTLKLGNNEIRTLDALTVLVSLKVGFGVDLKNNLVCINKLVTWQLFNFMAFLD